MRCLCRLRAAPAAVRFCLSVVGVAWGSVVGAASGRPRAVGRAVLTSTLSFASFLGCYSGTICLAERARGQADDWVRSPAKIARMRSDPAHAGRRTAL